MDTAPALNVKARRSRARAQLRQFVRVAEAEHDSAHGIHTLLEFRILLLPMPSSLQRSALSGPPGDARAGEREQAGESGRALGHGASKTRYATCAKLRFS